MTNQRGASSRLGRCAWLQHLVACERRTGRRVRLPDVAGGLEIRLVGRPRGVKLTGIEAVANADGTTTFVAGFKRAGFAITVR